MFWTKKAKKNQGKRENASPRDGARGTTAEKQYPTASPSAFKEALDQTLKANEKAWENLAKK